MRWKPSFISPFWPELNLGICPHIQRHIFSAAASELLRVNCVENQFRNESSLNQLPVHLWGNYFSLKRQCPCSNAL